MMGLGWVRSVVYVHAIVWLGSGFVMSVQSYGWAPIGADLDRSVIAWHVRGGLCLEVCGARSKWWRMPWGCYKRYKVT
eukprot:1731307-Prymnesium_polylepis.1